MTARVLCRRSGPSGRRNAPWAALAATLLCGSVAAQTTIELTPSSDTSLFEEGALANGAGQHLFTGSIAFGPRRRALLRFDLSAIPAGATIEGVELALSMSRTISGTLTVRLHRVLAAWTEGPSDAPGQEGIGAPAQPGEPTWDERAFMLDPWTTPGGDFDSIESAATPVRDLGVYRWSAPGMTADVQRWLDDAGSNHGWIVIGNEAAGFGTAKRFDSREHPDPAARPRLVVSFSGAAPPPPAPAPIPALHPASLLLLAAALLCCGWRRGRRQNR